MPHTPQTNSKPTRSQEQLGLRQTGRGGAVSQDAGRASSPHLLMFPALPTKG